MAVHGLTITKQITVHLNWTASQWELYSSAAKAAEAATALNFAFTDAVNGGLNEREVSEAVGKVMQAYSNEGAMDSEPRHHLERLLRAVFGEEVPTDQPQHYRFR